MNFFNQKVSLSGLFQGSIGWGVVIFLFFQFYGMFSLKGDVASIEEAKDFLVGTWVYSQPITDDAKYPWWERIEVREDGTVSVQNALPSDTKWGAPEIKKYQVITSKFIDTGERYYAMSISDSRAKYVINKDGTLVMQIAPYVAQFKRGDKKLNN